MKTLFLIILGIHYAGIAFSDERQIITSDGTQLHVTVKGAGLPVLYLHGGPGSGSYWLEVFMGEFLEQHFKMIYLDQRGVGRSGSPSDDNFSLDRFVLDFEEVRQALGLETWLTLGHSFGGILQTAYSERHPDSVTGMMIINGSLNMSDSFNTSWCPKASEFLELPEPLPCLDETIPLFDRWGELIRMLNEKDLMWKMGYLHPESIHKMNRTYQDIDNWNPDFSNLFIEYEEYMTDFRPVSATLNMPILFYYGAHDWMIGPDHYKDVYFPNMLLWEGDTGHMPFLENRDDLKNAIHAFLETFSF
jgi:proline iminopeptidase